jgi:hypothetical protein
MVTNGLRKTASKICRQTRQARQRHEASWGNSAKGNLATTVDIDTHTHTHLALRGRRHTELAERAALTRDLLRKRIHRAGLQQHDDGPVDPVSRHRTRVQSVSVSQSVRPRSRSFVIHKRKEGTVNVIADCDEQRSSTQTEVRARLQRGLCCVRWTQNTHRAVEAALLARLVDVRSGRAGRASEDAGSRTGGAGLHTTKQGPSISVTSSRNKQSWKV